MNTLRPYQKAGFSDIFKAWETNDILMFMLPTGGGKTVTFMEVIRHFLSQGKRAMMIAHREELIYQAWKTLYNNKIFAGIIKSGEPEKFDLPCQVASIQTIARRKYLPPCDLIVIDEGHHVAKDNSYGKILAMYPKAKVLIVTATPYRLSGEGFENLLPGKKTQLIVNSTLKSLTDEGWLVPIKYYIAAMPDLSNLHLEGGDYKLDEATKMMELVPLVNSYLEYCPGGQMITFAIHVNHSKDIVVPQYIQQGIPAEHLDANTSDDDRKRIISDFKSGLIKVVSNVGILTEGSDFPNLDAVQLARPTKSLSLYMQMIGRVTRAEAGLVDNFSTADLRKYAISMSSKPHGIILDNCSAFKDHFFPYHPHKWNEHFIGKKNLKPEKLSETMEMLVYEYEDEKGVRRRI